MQTLHVICMNLKCLSGTQNEIVYVADDPYEKSEIISKQLKRTDIDRIFFVGLGVHVDEDSLACVQASRRTRVVVFRGKEGVD